MVLNRAPVLWSSIWVALMAVALITRPLLPVDETRYLAVAWEMWRDGNFLVPHLNGETYSHKPPLLFWLFHAGWAVFGINEWWPRFVAPLFGLGSLFLTTQLAQNLWPNDNNTKMLAPIILLGCIFWTLFTTLTMFDMIVAFFSLLGLIGIAIAWRARLTGASSLNGFIVLAIAIGFGLLAKGPAILLHTLPVALLAPLWGCHLTKNLNDPLNTLPAENPAPGWFAWYAGIFLATVFGTAIVLAWALPAARAGGEEYANAIFWGQSAGRIIDSFAHGRPWWWYLAVLPPLTLPWIVWPRLWQAARQLGRAGLDDGGIRFCICWFLPAFIAFSLISGKQLHYLLPDFPALAMIFAFLLVNSNAPLETPKKSLWIPALLFIAVGVLIALMMPNLMPVKFQNRYPGLAPAWAGLIVLAGIVVLWLPVKSLRQSVLTLTGLSVATAVAAHLIVMPMVMNSFDIKPLALKLGEWERQGIPLAHMNKYHGQYHFIGRLKNPMPLVGNLAPDLDVWMSKHPNGRVVTYYNVLPQAAKPFYTRRFRGKHVAVWNVKTILAHPGIAGRK